MSRRYAVHLGEVDVVFQKRHHRASRIAGTQAAALEDKRHITGVGRHIVQLFAHAIASSTPQTPTCEPRAPAARRTPGKHGAERLR